MENTEEKMVSEKTASLTISTQETESPADAQAETEVSLQSEEGPESGERRLMYGDIRPRSSTASRSFVRHAVTADAATNAAVASRMQTLPRISSKPSGDSMNLTNNKGNTNNLNVNGGNNSNLNTIGTSSNNGSGNNSRNASRGRDGAVNYSGNFRTVSGMHSPAAGFAMSNNSNSIAAPAIRIEASSPSAAAAEVPSGDDLGSRMKEQEQQKRNMDAQEFLEAILGQSLPNQDLYENLKDGVLLCKMMNTIRPASIINIVQSSNKWRQRENIDKFLAVCKSIGLNTNELFTTVDLSDNRGMNQVVNTILAMKRLYNHNDISNGNGNALSSSVSSSSTSTPTSTISANNNINLSSSKISTPTMSELTIRRLSSDPVLDLTKNTRSSNSSSVKNRKADLSSSSMDDLMPSTVDYDQKGENGDPAGSNNDIPGSSVPKRSGKEKPAITRTNRDHDEEVLAGANIITKSSTRDANKVVKQIAQYQIGNCIGKGQFGAVYKCLHVSTGKTAAIKRIKLDDDMEKELDNLMSEVELLKMLTHPNIVQYIGFLREEGYLNIILEYVENGSLYHTFRTFGAFPESLVVVYISKVLLGLSYLHTQGVIHCDIKAANILTTKDGNVKLSDFGVSKKLNLQAKDLTVAGTPNWMAPEIIELKGATTKSDIWSLGCTIIELLTGKPPYAELQPMTALFRIVEDESVPLPENISADLGDFLSKCFQKDPDNRWSAEQLLQHPWIVKNAAVEEPEDSMNIPTNSSTAGSHSTSPSIAIKSNGSAAGSVQLSPEDNVPVDMKDRLQLLKGSATVSRIGHSIPHKFQKTSFPKAFDCRICRQNIKRGFLCAECGLVCHVECTSKAPQNCGLSQEIFEIMSRAMVSNEETAARDKSTAFSMEEVAPAHNSRGNRKSPGYLGHKKSQSDIHAIDPMPLANGSSGRFHSSGGINSASTGSMNSSLRTTGSAPDAIRKAESESSLADFPETSASSASAARLKQLFLDPSNPSDLNGGAGGPVASHDDLRVRFSLDPSHVDNVDSNRFRSQSYSDVISSTTPATGTLRGDRSHHHYATTRGDRNGKKCIIS